MSWLERVNEFAITILRLFSDTCKTIFDFLNEEFLDAPLYYWIFGSGLFLFLVYKILVSLLPL